MTEKRLIPPRGFTLLELLVAIAVFAVSASLVYAIYDSVFSVVSHVDETAGLNRRARVVFEQMQLDLAGLYKGRSGHMKGIEYKTESEPDPILQFTTSAHLGFDPTAPPVSMAVVAYQLRPDRDARTFSLYRSDRPFRFGLGGDDREPNRSLLLCEDVVDFAIRYIDISGTEMNTWEARSSGLDDGVDDRRFPVLVRIELTLANDKAGSGPVRTYRTSVRVPPAVLVQRAESGRG